MRYVSRDKDGKINGSFARPQPKAQESVANNNAELKEFGVPDALTDNPLLNKIEEIIDFIENATPLSAETITWMAERKAIRG